MASEENLFKDLSVADITRAISEYEDGNVDLLYPEREKSYLIVSRRKYPPKTIMRLAVAHKLGRVPEALEFEGGSNSQYLNCLKGLGFRVETPKERSEKSGDSWTQVEIDSAVTVYLDILRLEAEGKPYKKSDFNRQLREWVLKGRSRASVEYRMQNISFVRERHGLSWIRGYPPAANAGFSVEWMIWGAVARYDPSIKAVVGALERFDQDVKALRMAGPILPPKGKKKPRRIEISSSQFQRDELVVAWVLQEAKGVCELCANEAPFKDSVGLPYLEVHHVKFLGEEGTDQIANAVALCPNCHRACHSAGDRAQRKEQLYARVGRLVRE